MRLCYDSKNKMSRLPPSSVSRWEILYLSGISCFTLYSLWSAG